MIKYQIPTQDNFHIFWNEDGSENAVAIEITEKQINLFQGEDWIQIDKKTFLEMYKLVKNT